MKKTSNLERAYELMRENGDLVKSFKITKGVKRIRLEDKSTARMIFGFNILAIAKIAEEMDLLFFISTVAEGGRIRIVVHE